MPLNATDLDAHLEKAKPYLGRLAQAFCRELDHREMLSSKVFYDGLEWMKQGGEPAMLKQQLFILMHGHVLGLAHGRTGSGAPDDQAPAAP